MRLHFEKAQDLVYILTLPVSLREYNDGGDASGLSGPYLEDESMSLLRTRVAALLLSACLALLVQSAIAQTASSAPGAESVERFKGELLKPSSTITPEGYQRGNLEEHGAKEILIPRHFQEALKASKKSPVLIFKHSTECSISAGAYKRLGAWLDEQGEDAPEVYLVKVIERRPVSKEIEASLKVKHESPQIILIDNRKTVWHLSQEAIDAAAIEKALDALKGTS